MVAFKNIIIQQSCCKIYANKVGNFGLQLVVEKVGVFYWFLGVPFLGRYALQSTGFENALTKISGYFQIFFAKKHRF